jgi:hypothetical protein
VANADVHVVIEELLLLHLHQLCLDLFIARIIGLHAQERRVVHRLHVSVIHKLVLLHYVLRCRVVYFQHLGRFFDRDTLCLHNVDQFLPFVIIYLNVVSFSSE